MQIKRYQKERVLNNKKTGCQGAIKTKSSELANKDFLIKELIDT